jgi:hypothetical protein
MGGLITFKIGGGPCVNSSTIGGRRFLLTFEVAGQSKAHLQPERDGKQYDSGDIPLTDAAQRCLHPMPRATGKAPS